MQLPDVLCVPVIQGSTVDIPCSYTYPSRINGLDTKVEKGFWFTELNNDETVDLTTVSEYSGRVQYHSENNDCTLRISELRERDSAVYKFMFTTNQDGNYVGYPGVTLTVTVVLYLVILPTSGSRMNTTLRDKHVILIQPPFLLQTASPV
ncbi:hypothetical protein FQN60_003410, partial [Etheostoma spectabile]